MPNSASAAVGRSQFDDFLFAPVGEEQNGMVLSVLSALARLDVDPWGEAESLARMSRDAATERMRQLIAALPSQASRRADPEAIATRLIALLPRLQIPKSTSVKKAPGPTVVTIDRRVLVFCLLMGLMLGVQLLARSVQPQAPADGGRGSAPSAVQAPGPPQ
jgi:hypothetical protein